MNSEMTVSAICESLEERKDGGSRHTDKHTFVFGFFYFSFVHRARPINVFVGELVLHIAAVNEHRMHTLFGTFFFFVTFVR